MSTDWTFVAGLSDFDISGFDIWSQDVSLDDTGLLMITARIDSYTPSDASPKMPVGFAIYRYVDDNADLIMTLTYDFDNALLYGQAGTLDSAPTVDVAMSWPGWGALILDSDRKSFTVATFADDPSLDGPPTASASDVSPVALVGMNKVEQGITGDENPDNSIHDGFGFYTGISTTPPPGVIIGQQWPRGMKSKTYGGSRLS